MIIGREEFNDDSVKAFIGEQALVIDKLTFQLKAVTRLREEQSVVITSLLSELDSLRLELQKVQNG